MSQASRAQVQLSLPAAMHHLPATVYDYGARSNGEAHGLVLTRPHFVDLMLDLAGYTAERDLGALSLLEPACGHGAFLVRAADRLCRSARSFGRGLATLRGTLRAYDIDAEHVMRTRQAVAEVVQRHGAPPGLAADLASAWVQRGDFLLTEPGRTFDVVVGNPPYVRIEQLDPALQAEYRRRYLTLFDRADLYVAFIERSLTLLSQQGVLCFICADRWTLNRYGAPLRRMLAEGYRVRSYVELHRASAFESAVIAYPSIFVIGTGRSSDVEVGSLATGSPEECRAVAAAGGVARAVHPGVRGRIYPSWFTGDEPWVLSAGDHLGVLRDLEGRFEPLCAGGRARVGIGIATGNDSVYIVDREADVEPDRLVPLVMRQDIDNGRIRDASRCVLNTFGDDGEVVDLRRYPRLGRFLCSHEQELRRRHVAQKAGAGWFRTIDRLWPELVRRPKLLIPDIAGANEVVLEEGRFYPHHNLYYVVSDVWDLEVLGALLSSKVALFFVWAYAVKMRGGYLRFQAQYLRRIRVPTPEQVPPSLARDLCEAFRRRDFARLDELALRAYDLRELPEFSHVDTRR